MSDEHRPSNVLISYEQAVSGVSEHVEQVSKCLTRGLRTIKVSFGVQTHTGRAPEMETQF